MCPPGDVANSLSALDTTLQAFSTLQCLRVFVPGNHDVWVESTRSVRKGRDSYQKHSVAIPEVCQLNGFVCPTQSPYVLHGVAIVGSIGWYDYTLQDPRLAHRFGARDYDRGVFDGAVWNDARYAVWLRKPDSPNWRERAQKLPNHEIFARFFRELRASVDQIPASIDRTLIVLHTAPFRECLSLKDEPSPFDAHEGSTALGAYLESLSADRRIAVVVGHRHKKLCYERGNLRVYRSPVGYLDKEQASYAELAVSSIGEFTL